MSLPSLFRSFESEKKREYGEQITEVEHGSFTPLVFSACGGMGVEATVVVKKLASSLAVKRNEAYSRVVAWIRCCLAFALARSATRYIRGSRFVAELLNLFPWTWFTRRPVLVSCNSVVVVSCLFAVLSHFLSLLF